MFTYDTRAALADEHRAQMLTQADQARMVRTALGPRRRGAWLTRLGFSAPAARRPASDRRLGDRRVAKVPVFVERRTGFDRRSPVAA